MKKLSSKLSPILKADKSFYKKGIEMLEKRWADYIALEGDYVDE